MISVELLIKHMQWANKEIYTEISKLDDEVLEYYVIDPEWTVKKIMIHIVGAAYLFSQRLDGKPFSKFELKGENAHELFKWAKDNHGKSAVPKWNFHKILINKEGKIQNTYSSLTNPTSNKITNEIEKILNIK